MGCGGSKVAVRQAGDQAKLPSTEALHNAGPRETALRKEPDRDTGEKGDEGVPYPYGVCVFDIDGTLTARRSPPSGRVLAALAQLRARGAAVIVATGRPTCVLLLVHV